VPQDLRHLAIELDCRFQHQHLLRTGHERTTPDRTATWKGSSGQPPEKLEVSDAAKCATDRNREATDRLGVRAVAKARGWPDETCARRTEAVLCDRMAKRKQPPEPVSKTPAVPNGPAKTRTLPEGLQGAYFDGPDVATMLQIYNTDLAFELPRGQRTFTLGSDAKNDIYLRDEFVSRTHCLIERRGAGLRVHDQHTHNGTFFDGRKLDVFDPRPGDTFVVGRVRVLVLNDEMRAGLGVLGDILGSPDEATLRPSDVRSPSACDVVVAAKEGANILIAGEPGCDQERLAETIHGMSLRRGRELVRLDAEPADRAAQRAVIDRASRSTLVVTIHPKAPVMDSTFVSLLFDPTYHIRVIVLAPSVVKTRDVLGDAAISTMRQVSLVPLSQRPGSVPRLLDRELEHRGTTLRFSDITARNQAALVAHDWHSQNAPKNLAALRIAADRFPAIAVAPSLSQAAEQLGVSKSSLHGWFSDQLGLSWPLVTRG